MHSIQNLLGIQPNNTTLSEKLISGITGFIAIYAVTVLSGSLIDTQDMPLIVSSIGSSAVLLFAAPHGRFSQPWNLMGGHLIAATIGVSCAMLSPSPLLASSAAVGLSILAMYLLRCVHPPAGASAMLAVIGGPQIQGLGYEFVLVPLMLNVIIIFVLAIAINYLFAWRRYPAALQAGGEEPVARPGASGVEQEDIDFALREIGSYIDVTEEDLERIYLLARQHAMQEHDRVELETGNCYSNGQYGDRWAVRQITHIDFGEGTDDSIKYLIVTGADSDTLGKCTRTEFLRWASHEVISDDNVWKIKDRRTGGDRRKPRTGGRTTGG